MIARLAIRVRRGLFLAKIKKGREELKEGVTVELLNLREEEEERDQKSRGEFKKKNSWGKLSRALIPALWLLLNFVLKYQPLCAGQTNWTCCRTCCRMAPRGLNVLHIHHNS